MAERTAPAVLVQGNESWGEKAAKAIARSGLAICSNPAQACLPTPAVPTPAVLDFPPGGADGSSGSSTQEATPAAIAGEAAEHSNGAGGAGEPSNMAAEPSGVGPSLQQQGADPPQADGNPAAEDAEWQPYSFVGQARELCAVVLPSRHMGELSREELEHTASRLHLLVDRLQGVLRTAEQAARSQHAAAKLAERGSAAHRLVTNTRIDTLKLEAEASIHKAAKLQELVQLLESLLREQDAQLDLCYKEMANRQCGWDQTSAALLQMSTRAQEEAEENQQLKGMVHALQSRLEALGKQPVAGHVAAQPMAEEEPQVEALQAALEKEQQERAALAEQAEAAQKAMHDQIDQLLGQLASWEGACKVEQQKAQKLEKQLATAQRELAKTQGVLDAAWNELTEMQAELLSTRRDLDATRGQLAEAQADVAAGVILNLASASKWDGQGKERQQNKKLQRYVRQLEQQAEAAQQATQAREEQAAAEKVALEARLQQLEQDASAEKAALQARVQQLEQELTHASQQVEVAAEGQQLQFAEAQLAGEAAAEVDALRAKVHQLELIAGAARANGKREYKKKAKALQAQLVEQQRRNEELEQLLAAAREQQEENAAQGTPRKRRRQGLEREEGLKGQVARLKEELAAVQAAEQQRTREREEARGQAVQLQRQVDFLQPRGRRYKLQQLAEVEREIARLESENEQWKEYCRELEARLGR